MRWLAALVALGFVAACDGSNVEVNGVDVAEAGGYTAEIRASELEQTYLIMTPDGRTVGARAAEGASALMDGERAQSLAAEAPPRSSEEVPEVFSMRVPGFEMSVAGNEDGLLEDGDDDAVRLKLPGYGVLNLRTSTSRTIFDLFCSVT